jgi:hypothetical protein
VYSFKNLDFFGNYSKLPKIREYPEHKLFTGDLVHLRKMTLFSALSASSAIKLLFQNTSFFSASHSGLSGIGELSEKKNLEYGPFKLAKRPIPDKPE